MLHVLQLILGSDEEEGGYEQELLEQLTEKEKRMLLKCSLHTHMRMHTHSLTHTHTDTHTHTHRL